MNARAKQGFFGWWVALAAFITFGLSTGLPYYNLGFFYNYYTKPVAEGGFGWSRSDAVLGFPLAALFTLWVGPLLIHRLTPKVLILAGTALTFLAFSGFANMPGSLWVYYGLFFVYTVGYILSGPIPHQVLISQWFRKLRGTAMGLVYVGVGVFGSLGSIMVRDVTAAYGYKTALLVLGFTILLAWPVTFLLVRNKPSEVGQFADGADAPPADAKIEPRSFGWLLKQPAFWLLTIGSFCSIGSIGAVNANMKFVFEDSGFRNRELDSIWTVASVAILWSSILGRVFVGWIADRASKKLVMSATYFLVAVTIPIMLAVTPKQPEFVYVFAVLFGFGMGADYMLIPLMAAEQFGVNTLARAMAIILPTDTIGQTWFPYAIAKLRESIGSYPMALNVVFVVAFIGAVAVTLLPRKRPDEARLGDAKAEGIAASKR
ncbi:MAG TPA: MFS transporter [Bryobacteraceae bacterium]|nr:MFS transporter [Bryobacteraceae bacterium]